MNFKSNQEWAEALFANAELGDDRRTKRLVRVAQEMSASVDHSIHAASGNPASIEAAYRFIRNQAISHEAIANAGYQYTDKLVAQRPKVLAIQDTTGLSYRHSVCDELGEVNSSNAKRNSAKGRTIYAHSTLMLDAESEQVLGLSNQYYWHREAKNNAPTHILQERPLEAKESYKWQRSVETLAERLPSMSNIIDVCDREADIYDYLAYQCSKLHRFIVRASDFRRLKGEQEKLDEFAEQQATIGSYEVKIQQRGGRKSRVAKVALMTGKVTLRKPQRAVAQNSVAVNLVYCKEIDPVENQEPLKWLLYTTEPVNTTEEARKVVRYYELRWRVEEFHKTWKTDGTRVEGLRMQAKDNLLRAATIKAFIAVRLMQLRDLVRPDDPNSAADTPCDCFLSTTSWKILWKKVEKAKAIPASAPSLRWSYYALGKLGNWKDTARTGRVGIKALWEGWETLMMLVESYEELKGLDL